MSRTERIEVTVTRDELAAVIKEHRKCQARRMYAYECICGEEVSSNSHHVQSKHIADKIIELLTQ